MAYGFGRDLNNFWVNRPRGTFNHTDTERIERLRREFDNTRKYNYSVSNLRNEQTQTNILP